MSVTKDVIHMSNKNIVDCMLVPCNTEPSQGFPSINLKEVNYHHLLATQFPTLYSGNNNKKKQ